MDEEALTPLVPESPESGAQPNKVTLAKTHYTHAAMADMILANPRISQRELAAHFGYTESWISIVINSDAFQAMLADRKSEVVDPLLRRDVEEAIKGLVSKSVEILRDKLASPNSNTDLALEVFKSATKAAGYGARTGSTTVNVNAPGSLVNLLSGMDSPRPNEKVIEAEPAK